MLFKFFFFFPLVLFAMPGYHPPFGKDADLSVHVEKKEPLPSPSIGVLIAKQIIVFHQKVISPIDGPRSHFRPCSSQYMKLCMFKHGFIKGFLMGCDRLLRENKDPWVYREIMVNEEKIKYDPPR